MTGAGFRYSAFGLQLVSAIELPELAPFADEATGAPVVNIRLGKTPRALDAAHRLGGGVFARRDEFLLDVEAARFLVTGGQTILVEPKPSASARDLRGYLLGSVVGALCLQRGALPLHANAVCGDDGCVAFAGPSGAGKSTIAARFLQIGRSVLCDDVCVVTCAAGAAPQAWPGVARIKLWSDALSALGCSPEGLETVFEGESKYSLPLPEPLAHRPATLRAIQILSSDRSVARAVATRLSGRAAAAALLANIYRWEFAAALGVTQILFAQVLAVAASCPIFELRLPSRLTHGSWSDDLNQLLHTR